MIEMVPGISNALIGMVHERLAEHRNYATIINQLGEGGIRRQLETQMKWVMGFYEGPLCIAAMWGNHEIHLVTRAGSENKWATPKMFREFWRWFFDHNDKAVVTPDNGLVIPFLLRMGFRWENNKLVMDPEDLRISV